MIAIEQKEDVKELFESMSVQIPDLPDLRAMSFETFKIAVDKMMNEAFYSGVQHGMSTVENIMDSVFKEYK